MRMNGVLICSEPEPTGIQLFACSGKIVIVWRGSPVGCKLKKSWGWESRELSWLIGLVLAFMTGNAIVVVMAVAKIVPSLGHKSNVAVVVFSNRLRLIMVGNVIILANGILTAVDHGGDTKRPEIGLIRVVAEHSIHNTCDVGIKCRNCIITAIVLEIMQGVEISVERCGVNRGRRILVKAIDFLQRA